MSEFSSATSPLSTITEASLPTVSSSNAILLLHHAVTVRLSKANFLLWRAQLLSYLRSNNLMGYIDGTKAAPPMKIPMSTAPGATLIDNPDYVVWNNTDQQLLSGLFSTMSEEVLRDVITATTSQEVWDSLQKKFSSSTRARTVQLRVELATAQKRDLSATDYFSKIKNLATEMEAANATLSDDEILSYLLAGLPSEYDPYVTSMTTKDSITLDDAYAHLVAFEARQLKHHAALQLNVGSSANYAGRGSGQNRGRGRPDRGRGRSRGGAPPRSNGNRRGSSYSRTPCQICGKEGHTAVRCWYRMDDSYNEDPPSAALASTSYKVDSDWYTDTGATDHITSDLDRCPSRALSRQRPSSSWQWLRFAYYAYWSFLN